MLIQLQNIGVSFGENLIFKNIDASVNERDRIGLIGYNGAGKTTLLNVLTKKLVAETGELFVKRNLRIGFLEQNSGLEKDATILEEMYSVFSDLLKAIDKLREIEQKMSEGDHSSALQSEYQRLTSFVETNDGYHIDVKIKKILNGMGFASKNLQMNINGLSGGEKTRLAIAKLLLENPELLILDEPTNHLDFKTLIWLEEYLSNYKGSLIIVSHDRYFLDKTVNNIWEIAEGELITYKGNYTQAKEQKRINALHYEREYEKQQKQMQSMEDFAKRNMARASTSNLAKSRLNLLSHIEEIKKPMQDRKKPTIRFSFEEKSGNDVLSIKNLDLCVGKENTVIVKNIDMEVKRGNKIAVIGENGTGKSTLLKALYRNENIAAGEIFWGKNVTKGYYDQQNSDMIEEMTVIEQLQDRYPAFHDGEARSMLARVLIVKDEIYKKVGDLSGGERAKLGFALIMSGDYNTLILDEPTNHLDLMSREVLEQALKEYEGTLIMVSHDRYFLNAVAERIYEIENGEVKKYDGNFGEYLQKKQQDTTEEKKIQTENKIKSGEKLNKKQLRSIHAKRRDAYNRLEKEILQTEEKIKTLENEIQENPSDYELIANHYTEIELLKNREEELMEELVLLEENELS